MAYTEALVLRADAKSIAIKTDIQSLVKDARELAISDEHTYGRGADIVKSFKGKKALLEEERKELVDPINNSVKIINAKFKPQTEECDIWIKAVDKKLYVYKEAEEQKRRIEEAKRRAEEQALLEAQKKDILDAATETGSEELFTVAAEKEQAQNDLKTQPVEITKSVAIGTLGTAKMYDHWKHEVINEALVLPGLKTTDDKKVREYLKKMAETPAVLEKMKAGEQILAGVRFWNEPSSVSR